MTVEVGVRLRGDGKGLVGELKNAERELNRLSGGTRKAGSEANRAGSQIRKFGQDTEKASQSARKLNDQAQGTGKALNALKTLLPSIGIAIFTGQVIAAGLAMTRMRNSLLAVTGSSQAAQAELDFVRATADRLGLSFQELAQSYTAFTAASAGTRLEGEATRDIFTAVAESARVLGLSTAETEGALRALQQMMSKGTVQAEELRGQLGERLPGAFQIAARAMGVSTQELGKMLEQGQVLAEDLLPKLAAELRNTYGRGLESATSSAGAAFGRLQSSLFALRAEVAESGFMEGLATSTERLVDALNSPGAIAAAQALGKAMGFVAENLDVIAVALGAGFAAKMTGAAVAMGRAAVSAKALGAGLALMTGPAGIVAAAAAGIYLLVDAINSHEGASDTARAAQDEYTAAIKQGGDGAIEAAKKVIAAKEAEIGVMVEAQELARQIHGEGTATPGLDKAINDSLERIRAIQQEIKAMEAGFTATANLFNDETAKTGGGFKTVADAVDDAASKVREYIDAMEQAAELDMMSERDRAAAEAWTKAVKAGIEATDENREMVERVARALYDQKAAQDALNESKKEAAELDREAAEAALAAQAAAEQALADQNAAYEEMIAAKRASLEEQASALQQSLETETETIHREYRERIEILEQAEAEGIQIIGGYQQARERMTAEMLGELTALEQDHANQAQEIWDNMVQGMQSAFTDAIYNGLFEDGINSWGDFMDTLKDLWKRMIAELISAWVTSGIVGLLSGKGFGGFNIGGIGGGSINGIGGPIGIGGGGISINPLSLANAATGGGATGSILGTVGGTAGANAAGAIFGAGSYTAASAAFAAGDIFAGIPGLTMAGGAAPTAGGALGGLGGLGAGGMAVGGLAAAFLLYKMFGGGRSPTEILADEMKDIQSNASAGNKAGWEIGGTGGAIGHMLSADGTGRANQALHLKDNAAGRGLAAFAESRGAESIFDNGFGKIDSIGGTGFKDIGELVDAYREIIKLIPEMADAAVKAFGESAASAEEYRQVLADGIVDETEQAALGIEYMGDMTVEQFGRMVDVANEELPKFAETATSVFEETGKSAEWFANAMEDGIVSASEFAELGVDGMGSVSVEVFRQMVGAAAATEQSIRDIAAAYRSVESAASGAASATRRVGNGGRSAQVDGSHAAGMHHIPFNGYLAMLHQGERVKTRAEARIEDQEKLHDSQPANLNVTPIVDAIERQTHEVRRQGRDWRIAGIRSRYTLMVAR